MYYFTRDTSNECRWWWGKITTKCGCPFFLRSMTDMWIRCVTMSLLVLAFSVSLKKGFVNQMHAGLSRGTVVVHKLRIIMLLWGHSSRCCKKKKWKSVPCYLVLPCSRSVTRQHPVMKNLPGASYRVNANNIDFLI